MPLLHSGAVSQIGHLVVGADPVGLSTARKHIHTIAKEHFAADEALDVLIAVGEAISNAYRHGTPNRQRGLISVDWCFSGAELTVSVKDEGPGFSPGSRKCLTDTVPRIGRGLDIIKRIVDDVYVEYDNGTRLVMIKRVSWEPRARVRS